MDRSACAVLTVVSVLAARSRFQWAETAAAKAAEGMASAAGYEMTRYRREYEVENGWSRWVPPVMRGYKMSCCDCGLVHDMNFRVVRVIKRKRNGIKVVEPAGAGFEVIFKARRNRRATAQVRRHKKHDPAPPASR
jgi:hypothetical protein